MAYCREQGLGNPAGDMQPRNQAKKHLILTSLKPEHPILEPFQKVSYDKLKKLKLQGNLETSDSVSSSFRFITNSITA